jgi:hypothetical protein
MLLTYLANKPGGAQHVIQGVLNIGQDTQGAETHTIKKYTIIATVISNPVLSNAKYQDLEQYFSVVCPQILDILIKSQVYQKLVNIIIQHYSIMSIKPMDLIIEIINIYFYKGRP